MFESQTYEAILNRMLEKVPLDVDKRKGSLVYDMLAPMAAELAEHYSQLEGVVDMLFIRSAQGEWLDKLGIQFGIPRREATCAVRRADCYEQDGQQMDIAVGTRFRCEQWTYVVQEKLEDGGYALCCEQPGMEGGLAEGVLLPIDYLPQLQDAVLGEVLSDGSEQETDDAYRNRIISVLEQPAFGGNPSQYRAETLNIVGVGDVEVFPAFAGGGTVGLVLAGVDGEPVSAELVQQVQSHYEGDGNEQNMAPIGHKVTVKSCVEKKVSVQLQVQLKEGHTLENLKQSLQERIRASVHSVPMRQQRLYAAQIVAAVLEEEAVLDVPMDAVYINGQKGNLTLSKTVAQYEVPILESAQITEVT